MSSDSAESRGAVCRSRYTRRHVHLPVAVFSFSLSLPPAPLAILYSNRMQTCWLPPAFPSRHNDTRLDRSLRVYVFSPSPVSTFPLAGTTGTQPQYCSIKPPRQGTPCESRSDAHANCRFNTGTYDEVLLGSLLQCRLPVGVAVVFSRKGTPFGDPTIGWLPTIGPR